MSTYRIVLADDHVMFRQGLTGILQCFQGLKVVGEAGSYLELLRQLRDRAPDMVIMELAMSTRTGLDATRKLKLTRPHIKILVLTRHRSRAHLIKAVSAGAEGYVLKEDNNSELFTAIEKIRNGGIYISHRLSGELPHILESCTAGTGLFSPLAVEERKILELTIRGKSTEEIAASLSMCASAIQQHRKHIIMKMNIREAIELASRAIQREYES